MFFHVTVTQKNDQDNRVIFFFITLFFAHRFSLPYLLLIPLVSPTILPFFLLCGFLTLSVQFVQFYFLLLGANPLLIRSLFVTEPKIKPESFAASVVSQSLLHQVYVSHVRHLLVNVGNIEVSIPSSSGLCFSQQPS